MQTITDICNVPASAVSQMLMQPVTLNEKNFHPSGSQLDRIRGMLSSLLARVVNMKNIAILQGGKKPLTAWSNMCSILSD